MKTQTKQAVNVDERAHESEWKGVSVGLKSSVARGGNEGDKGASPSRSWAGVGGAGNMRVNAFIRWLMSSRRELRSWGPEWIGSGACSEKCEQQCTCRLQTVQRAVESEVRESKGPGWGGDVGWPFALGCGLVDFAAGTRDHSRVGRRTRRLMNQLKTLLGLQNGVQGTMGFFLSRGCKSDCQTQRGGVGAWVRECREIFEVVGRTGA